MPDHYSASSEDVGVRCTLQRNAQVLGSTAASCLGRTPTVVASSRARPVNPCRHVSRAS